MTVTWKRDKDFYKGLASDGAGFRVRWAPKEGTAKWSTDGRNGVSRFVDARRRPTPLGHTSIASFAENLKRKRMLR